MLIYACKHTSVHGYMQRSFVGKVQPCSSYQQKLVYSVTNYTYTHTKIIYTEISQPLCTSKRTQAEGLTRRANEHVQTHHASADLRALRHASVHASRDNARCLAELHGFRLDLHCELAGPARFIRVMSFCAGQSTGKNRCICSYS